MHAIRTSRPDFEVPFFGVCTYSNILSNGKVQAHDVGNPIHLK